MVPPSLFRHRDLAGAVLLIGIVFVGLGGLGLFMAQYFQLVQDRSALASGIRVLPIGIGIALVSPLAGPLTHRIGPRALVAVAALFTTGGTALLTQVAADSEYPVLLLALGAIGLGGGLGLTPLTDTVMAAVPLEDAGIASALNDASRFLGAALGIALLGTVLTEFYQAEVVSGLETQASTDITEVAARSIVHAVELAPALPSSAAAGLLEVARSAFADALARTMVPASVLVASGLLIGPLMLPARQRSEQYERSRELVER